MAGPRISSNVFNVDCVAKAFVLYYLHRVLPNKKFVELLKGMTSTREMMDFLQIFNSKVISCDAIMKFILHSEVFTRMCQRIDLANNLVLQFLSDSCLYELKNKFKKIVDRNADLSLETLLLYPASSLQSTSPKMDSKPSENIIDIIDLTLEDSSFSENNDSESSSDCSSSSSDEEVVSTIIRSESVSQSNSQVPSGGKRVQIPLSQYLIPAKKSKLSNNLPSATTLNKTVENKKNDQTTNTEMQGSARKDMTEEGSLTQNNCTSHVDNLEKEEEGLVPLHLKKQMTKVIPGDKDVNKRDLSILNKSQTKWTVEEDKLFISLVMTKNHFLYQWRTKKKLSDFSILQELFFRTSNSLYSRWQKHIYPFLWLYHEGSDILCWRLKLFKILSEQNYSTVKEISWSLVYKRMPVRNVTVYRSFFESFVSKSTDKSLREVIKFAIATLSNQLCHIDELKSHYVTLIKKEFSGSSTTNSSDISDPKSKPEEKDFENRSLISTSTIKNLNRSFSQTTIPFSSKGAIQISKNIFSSSLKDTNPQKSPKSTTSAWHSPQTTITSNSTNASTQSLPANKTCNLSHKHFASSSNLTKNIVGICDNNGKNWSLDLDLEFLYIILKINSPDSKLKDKVVFKCSEMDIFLTQLQKDINYLHSRWKDVILPSLLSNVEIKEWEITFLSQMITLNFETYDKIEWCKIRIPGAKESELSDYIQCDIGNSKNISEVIKYRLSLILKDSFTKHQILEKSSKSAATNDSPRSTVQSKAVSSDACDKKNGPFDYFESKAIIDHVFLHKPNLDLQTCELKPLFFVNVLDSRAPHIVFMHWEKLVCVHLFAARKDNWKISFLEYISHWGLNSFIAVFNNKKVEKLYSHVPKDAQKVFIQTCIRFSEATMHSATFLSKIRFCYEYLRLKKGDLCQYDKILEYSIPLFSPHQKAEKQWESVFKARSTFTFPERLEILKRVVHSYPDKDVSLICPSIEFFTNIAPEFDRSYVSLKYQWERSIRIVLLLFKHNKLNENWKHKVLTYFLKNNIKDRQDINWKEVLSTFPYLTQIAINDLIVRTIKKKESGSFTEKLRTAVTLLEDKNTPDPKLELWKPLLDFYANYEESRLQVD